MATALPAPRAAARAATRAVPVSVLLNGMALARPSLAVIGQGSILLRRSDLVSWGVIEAKLPGGEVLPGQEDVFVDLGLVEGLSVHLADDAVTLAIDARPELFGTHRFEPLERVSRPGPAIPAAFLQYDVSISRWSRQLQGAAQFDFGVSGQWGVIGSTAAARAVQGSRATLVRLESYAQRDFVDSNLRLQVGDTQSVPGPLGQPVLFAGIQLTRDFSQQPQAITMPLPSIRGATALPSVVDLASGAVQERFSTGTGDFTATFVPEFTGAGQVEVSVRDLSGAVTRISQNYYADRDLLRPGLQTFSLEAGALRKAFGIRNFSYGAPFAAGTLRRGITPGLTVGAHIEAGAQTQGASGSADVVVGHLAVLGAAASVARSDGLGAAVRWRLSARRVTRTYSLSASYTRTDANFRQLGQSEYGPPEEEFAFAASYTAGRIGSLDGGCLGSRRGGDRFRVCSARWNATFGRTQASVGAQVSDTRNAGRPRRNVGIFASLTRSLGPGTVAGLFADEDRLATSYQRSARGGQGLGFRSLAGFDLSRNRPVVEGEIDWQGNPGYASALVQHGAGETALSMRAGGAVLAAGGQIAAARRVDNGFALVGLPSRTALPLYFENRKTAARAGAGRSALVGGLLPFSTNRISVDPADLPLDENLESPAIEVVPGWRQVVRATFAGGGEAVPLRLRLLTPGGLPVAVGRPVTLPNGASTVVGYDGIVFLFDGRDAAGHIGTAGTGRSACRFEVPRGEGMLSLPVATCVPVSEVPAT